MKLTSCAALLAATLLAACGGNDREPERPTVIDPPVMPPVVVIAEVPTSAYASVAAYTAYAGTLAVSETTEPLDTEKVVAPTTETAEPSDV